MITQTSYRHPALAATAADFYDELLRLSPVTATYLGEHAYDGLLPEVGVEAVEKQIDCYRRYRDRFKALPERELTLDERIDRTGVLHLIETELFWSDAVRRWQLGIDLADTIGTGLYLLFTRDFAPLYERTENMISRLRCVPMYLESGKTLFRQVPKLWVDIFLDSAAGLPPLFSVIETGIAGRVPDFLLGQFRQARTEAERAIDHWRHWFQHAIAPKAQGSWALGAGPLQALLELRQLGLTGGEMQGIAEHHLRASGEKLDRLARSLAASGTRAEARHRLEQRHPRSFAQALDAYQDAINRSRAFVEQHGFASVPPAESLQIAETPSYLAHLVPFAAYLPPERRAPQQQGVYLVTPVTDATELRRHNFAAIAVTSIHEGYPGHHLQLATANRHPSKLRALFDAVETIEGWAFYCEEAMIGAGFEASDEVRFAQAQDEIFRAARVLIDLRIHDRSWTYDQARTFLQQQTGFDHAAAEAEMRRYTQTPGYPASYLIGKVQLLELKGQLQRRFGNDLPDRGFHDLVLSQGSLPLFLAREAYPDLVLRELQSRDR